MKFDRSRAQQHRLKGSVEVGMETSKLWRSPAASLKPPSNLTYRAEIVRRDPLGGSSIYYDGGEFAPYCLESLIEVLRFESQRPHELLDVSLELKGACNATTVRDLARKFTDLHEPRMHVRISAPGHPGVVISPESSPSSQSASGSAAAQKNV